MGCPRCGQNRGSGQIPQPVISPARPGTLPKPPVMPQPVRVNPSDAVRNAINGLRYMPNGK